MPRATTPGTRMRAALVTVAALCGALAATATAGAASAAPPSGATHPGTVCRDEGDLKCSDSYFTSASPAWSNQMYAYNITATAYAELWLDGGQAYGYATA